MKAPWETPPITKDLKIYSTTHTTGYEEIEPLPKDYGEKMAEKTMKPLNNVVDEITYGMSNKDIPIANSNIDIKLKDLQKTRRNINRVNSKICNKLKQDLSELFDYSEIRVGISNGDLEITFENNIDPYSAFNIGELNDFLIERGIDTTLVNVGLNEDGLVEVYYSLI